MDRWEQMLQQAAETREERRRSGEAPVFTLAQIMLEQIKQSGATEREAIAALETVKIVLPLLSI